MQSSLTISRHLAGNDSKDSEKPDHEGAVPHVATLRGNVDIDRPAPVVFDYVSNFENNPRWQNGMRACRFTSQQPLRVGSTYEQVASFLRKTIRTTFEVTALDPGRSVTIESRESTFAIRVTRSVEPLDDARCRVEATIEGGPGGVLRLLSPLITFFAQRSVRGDYARLKRLLESPAERGE